jgi:hypothetical protein
MDADALRHADSVYGGRRNRLTLVIPKASGSGSEHLAPITP